MILVLMAVMQEGSPLLRSEIVLSVQVLNLSSAVLLISNDLTPLEQPWFPS